MMRQDLLELFPKCTYLFISLQKEYLETRSSFCNTLNRNEFHQQIYSYMLIVPMKLEQHLIIAGSFLTYLLARSLAEASLQRLQEIPYFQF